ncbi:MAG: hypothetical protein PWQ91_417 [Eubacteriales bacterium]|nr:hypothetical protein [Eubacteriales bacterium]
MKRKFFLILLFAVVLSLILPGFCFAAADAKVLASGVERIYGPTRIETAVQLNESYFTDVSDAVLARSDDFPDALAGGVLAYHLRAPMLLTDREILPPNVLQFLKNHHIRKVYLLGGSYAITPEVELYLKSEGFTTERLGGANRFETAMKIMDKVKNLITPERLVITIGYDFPDALVSAPYAARRNALMLFVENCMIPPEVEQYIRSLVQEYPNLTAEIVGGPFVVSDDVKQDLIALLPKKENGVTRIGGLNRYETAAAVAEAGEETGIFNRDGVFIATGWNFPDALCAGPIAAFAAEPILLTDPNALPTSTKLYLEKSPPFPKAIIVGGPQAVSSTVEETLANYVAAASR